MNPHSSTAAWQARQTTDPPHRRVDDTRTFQGALHLWEALVVVVQCLEGGDDIREPDPTWRSEPVHPPELGEDWWFGLLHQTREWLLGPNGEVLLQAVRAAFGPAGDADHDTLDTQCQRLAKRCWERIPASLHRELRDAILEIPDECWHVHELVRAYPTLVAGAALAARELFAHDRDE